MFSIGKVLPVKLEEEMKSSYLDYAMSVIVGRALPDVRDGLKPVHRRILYAMHILGMTPDKPHRKSAHIVGEVLGKFHPHGDVAVYDAMVRMAQDFSTRYPLIDGHGNFGSVDGDSAAAMRYTEARMAKITVEMLRDIDKETVDFMPNYDNSTKEPVVLPSRIPNLLVNGSSGIAVGMATNIPPHNLREVIDGVVKMIDDPEVEIGELMKIIKGPDFPTGGKIMGRQGIRQAYTTGRGTIKVRAVTTFEKLSGGKTAIIVTELPYQVNKAKLIEKIAELVRDKKIDGIADLRDESDRKGMRIVIELKRDANPQVVLNQLFKHTQLQDTFGIIMLALVDNQPRILNLKEILFYYLEHQKDVVTRRTRYDLNKAEERAHILEGLKIALANLDEVIKIIRGSKDVDTAREGLMSRFGLTEKQAQAILDMRLQRLTALEREKIDEEYRELIKKIEYFNSILADERVLLGVIRQELLEIKEKYGDARRTQITNEESIFDEEDLIAEEDMVITITHQGYIKRLPVDTYKNQRRGGRGVTAMATKEEDFVRHLFVTSTHNYLLFFTNKGKVYRLKVHEIPEAGRQAKGTPIVNLLYVDQDERITAIIPVKEFTDDHYLFMVTKNGIVKKTVLSEYDSSRRDGIIALSLEEGDKLIDVKLSTGQEEVIIGTKKGMAIRFSETDVRPMGRTARGVKGITLSPGDEVIGLEVVDEQAELLTVTSKGFGKKTPFSEYRVQGRGGKGIINMKVTQKNGEVVGIVAVRPEDEVMAISGEGIMIRVKAAEISTQGRATQGVTLMKLNKDDQLTAVAKIAAQEDEEND
ncbi:DNA gyrase subunit A [Carboxydothermus hydrogenoformans]|uniref:DNA gyrase subunit A n=1 Tax=Carboxydothermus hydrogenoformans (strain ATCC BAA-161 / DSM 6008 / Z-2901) TaxID=246194 RepID=Q3A8P8_CARHZ|nr:DNA gyrase subunit A [Carboxydothermus hydrogenoformans]ABB16016.1 DNA gyrase, A subunit [Carboxydothermus hydrogenoformans Z-2901]